MPDWLQQPIHYVGSDDEVMPPVLVREFVGKGDLIIEVVTEEREGVVLYKDYNFIDNDKKTAFKL